MKAVEFVVAVVRQSLRGGLGVGAREITATAQGQRAVRASVSDECWSSRG